MRFSKKGIYRYYLKWLIVTPSELKFAKSATGIRKDGEVESRKLMRNETYVAYDKSEQPVWLKIFTEKHNQSNQPITIHDYVKMRKYREKMIGGYQCKE